LTSVTTATTLAVILEKSMYALRISELIGATVSWIAVIFMRQFRIEDRDSRIEGSGQG
jgi:hypothetical protein